MEILFLFLVGHAVCDFVLQPEVMGVWKSRKRYRAAEHQPGFPPWYFWLSAHGLTHGGAVYLVTGLWYLGALESVLHVVIDHQKCEERISFIQDQAIHIACKLGYVLFLVLSPA